MELDLFDAAANQVLLAPTYTAFKETLLNVGCVKCRLAEGRTHLVVDRGSPQARILLIGEAPGEHEDREGRAFVGRAGQLLDKIMAAIGLDTNRDCLIVNIVKCRPPENRSPLRDEAEACRPYLQRQIALVKPRIILLLGATALKHVVPTKVEFSMQREAGAFFTAQDYPGIQLMVLYHPAYLLRDPSKKGEMWQHVQRLKQFLIAEGLHPAARPAG